MNVLERFALDTSAVILSFRKSTLVQQFMDEADTIFLPLVTLGELHFGIERAPQKTRFRHHLELLLRDCDVLKPDEETAQRYGQIKATLWNNGTPIPDNDIWIAALAIQAGLPLLARDEHFDFIQGLEVVHV